MSANGFPGYHEREVTMRLTNDHHDVHLGVSSSNIIHETIDGEVIVIDLTTGTYYSLKGTAADAWGLIQRPEGVARGELVSALSARYGTSEPDLETALEPFLAELADEGLVASTNGGPRSAGGSGSAAELGTAQAGDTFEAPLLEKFTDMQDLVLLDPVHEVDEAGWPQRSPDASGGGSP